ncbi:Fic family protein [bacterium]|nr:Fic family protein [bacterium]
MAHPSNPKNRSEAEILGYRQALSKIHAKPESFSIDEKTILGLHSQIYSRTDIPSGQWKKRDNTIEERLSDGRWITRFVPVSARETPGYMKEFCIRFNRLRKEGLIASTGTGRGALWEKRGNAHNKRGNKRGNKGVRKI